MPTASPLLDKILNNQNRTTTLKVVFVDVQSYSKRKSQMQAAVIDAFMQSLKTAHDKTSQHYMKYAQDNNLNFSRDVITLPTGDGAAISFPFEGLYDIHLFFAKELLRATHEHNKKNPCEKFEENGWCHCHSNFNLCAGISDGKGIIYKDFNGNYNVAGSAINLAARVMTIANPMQILFSEEAYRQFIDMNSDINVDERFREYDDVKIKHGEKISVFQYLEPDVEYINIKPVSALHKMERMQEAMGKLGSLMGIPMPVPGTEIDQKKFEVFIESLMKSLPESALPI